MFYYFKTMKRTFIAVEINPGEKLLEALSFLRTSLSREKIKWVSTANMHITLAFIGDTPAETVRSLSRSLSEECSGAGKVTFTLKGTGLFPSLSRPKVIWAGTEDAGSLIKLNEKVAAIVKSHGIPIEEREFKPHLTLGRIKFIKDNELLAELIAEYSQTIFQEAVTDELVYFESLLMPSGPVYKPITRIKL